MLRFQKSDFQGINNYVDHKCCRAVEDMLLTFKQSGSLLRARFPCTELAEPVCKRTEMLSVQVVVGGKKANCLLQPGFELPATVLHESVVGVVDHPLHKRMKASVNHTDVSSLSNAKHDRQRQVDTQRDEKRFSMTNNTPSNISLGTLRPHAEAGPT